MHHSIVHGLVTVFAHTVKHTILEMVTRMEFPIGIGIPWEREHVKSVVWTEMIVILVMRTGQN